MQYLLLIYETEGNWEKLSEAEQAKIMQEYYAFDDSVKKVGKLIAGEALQPISTATTVRVREGKTITTDGPFAETREQLGGFYLVDVKDLDEALACAARIPTARTGSVEVRPVMKFDM